MNDKPVNKSNENIIFVVVFLIITLMTSSTIVLLSTDRIDLAYNIIGAWFTSIAMALLLIKYTRIGKYTPINKNFSFKSENIATSLSPGDIFNKIDTKNFMVNMEKKQHFFTGKKIFIERIYPDEEPVGTIVIATIPDSESAKYYRATLSIPFFLEITSKSLRCEQDALSDIELSSYQRLMNNVKTLT